MTQHDRQLVFLEKLPPGVILRTDGLYYVEVKDDGAVTQTWLCGYLRPTLLARCHRKTDWQVQLEFEDMDGRMRTILIPRNKLGTGNHAISALLAQGFDVHHDPARRKILTGLLAQMKPSRRAILTQRLGWQEDGLNYVFVDGSSLGPEDILYEGPDRLDDASRGTLEGWRHGVARYAPGNPLMVVGLSLALAGPLVRPLRVPSGFLHIYGGSSLGKSTVLLCAASVYTAPHHVESWRVTDSALERVAEAHSGRFLPKDELGDVEARHFNASSYMLAHERGKARFRLSGSGLAYVAHWELLGLSTGEISAVEKLLEGGIKAKEGQKARILDIPVAGYKHGIHDELHGHKNGRSLSDALIAAANEDHGVAGKAMVTYILSDIDRVTAQARAEMEAFEALVEAHRPDAHGGIHGRVRQRFALIAAGGEIASAAGITGWPAGVARTAAYEVYERWLNAQGPSPEQQVRAADDARLERLRLFLKAERDRIRDLDVALPGDTADYGPDPVAWLKSGALPPRHDVVGDIRRRRGSCGKAPDRAQSDRAGPGRGSDAETAPPGRSGRAPGLQGPARSPRTGWMLQGELVTLLRARRGRLIWAASPRQAKACEAGSPGISRIISALEILHPGSAAGSRAGAHNPSEPHAHFWTLARPKYPDQPDRPEHARRTCICRHLVWKCTQNVARIIVGIPKCKTTIRPKDIRGP